MKVRESPVLVRAQTLSQSDRYRRWSSVEHFNTKTFRLSLQLNFSRAKSIDERDMEEGEMANLERDRDREETLERGSVRAFF